MYNKPFSVPLEEYESLICCREYWDDISTEWESSPIEQKIIRLAGFVQQGGDLMNAINLYAQEHDETYRRRIQHCILEYILILMTGDKIEIYRKSPFKNRIKRLNKDELVKLLSDQLKASVIEGSYMDKNYNTLPCWEIRYDNKLTPDEYMDKVDHEHYQNYPDESFTTYDAKSENWNNPTYSLW